MNKKIQDAVSPLAGICSRLLNSNFGPFLQILSNNFDNYIRLMNVLIMKSLFQTREDLERVRERGLMDKIFPNQLLSPQPGYAASVKCKYFLNVFLMFFFMLRNVYKFSQMFINI